MYETILLPIDGSDGSTVATRHVASLASTYGATVVACAVVDTRNRFGGSDEETPVSAVSAERRIAAERALSSAREAIPESVPTETELGTGVPARAIRTVADEVDADVIVMGTHGRTGLSRQLHGSVTERVVRTADVPVVSVPLDGGPSTGES